MNDWTIVKSKSNQHPTCGYPMGELLCRTKKEAKEVIKNSEFKDCYMEKYGENNEAK